MAVFKIYVEKKEQFATEAKNLTKDLIGALNLNNITKTRIVNRYEIEGIDKQTFKLASETVFSEPLVDCVYFELEKTKNMFACEYLEGQFNKRADSCEQCIQLITHKKRPIVKTAKIFIFEGNLKQEEIEKIKSYIINPIETKEASLEEKTTLKQIRSFKTEVETIESFNDLNKEELSKFIELNSLSISLDDILLCQDYFKNVEKRPPTITELKVIDTYWSDHCRHTTFSTEIFETEILDEEVLKTFEQYIKTKNIIEKEEKPVTLMDIATIAAKKLKLDGFLKDLDESDEINACSVNVEIETEEGKEDWLLMFKNETHNHPTEIEPFGGAATCLGGAIRDPLSGRAYVYQAMRITGAANPKTPFEKTLNGKLPQRKIVTTAAEGYSSYGNQIGIATGFVKELYHEKYVAKRLEIGAVVGAVLKKNVVRKCPENGDEIVLIGGKTGRDGCGGATGSSQSQNEKSIETCGAQVQKGNPVEERKLQRFFKNEKVSKLIKRCNDFGAGGVAVAVGELAKGVEINLNSIVKKYDGLDGTDLAISESQERMAVVVSKEDLEKFIEEANKENILATKIATVTNKDRLTMDWNGKKIVDISRKFLNSNGAKKQTKVLVKKQSLSEVKCANNWIESLSDLNSASQKGLVSMFDSTIGSSTVLMPFGGKFQSTEIQAAAAKIPTGKNSKEVSLIAFGFNPYLMDESPFYGAQYSVIESIAKIVACGGSLKKCWLTFQEYFPKTENSELFGLVFAALLGAFKAQMEFKIAAIGGKDSMSGTFQNLKVPPTLVSFAVSVSKADNIISPEFKKAGSKVAFLSPKCEDRSKPNYESLKETFAKVEDLISKKVVISAWAVGFFGVCEAISKMCFGNKLGFSFNKNLEDNKMFGPGFGSFVLELEEAATIDESLEIIGTTSKDYYVTNCDGSKISLSEIENANNELEDVYRTKITPKNLENIENFKYFNFEYKPNLTIKKPKPTVLIPIFPGTNCEYDVIKKFEEANANCECLIINNLNESKIAESVNEFNKKIKHCQILMLAGGFSGADEPDGAGKFITAFFRNSFVEEQTHRFLELNDGLILGICNGFQALIKLGLIEHGKITNPKENFATLTNNDIGRHQSLIVNTKVISNKSPWLANSKPGEIFNVAISHGEGKLTASKEVIENFAKNGQIATQYVNLDGEATMDVQFNPNGSVFAIEGLTSKDGKIFGKMGHNERSGYGLYKNIPNFKNLEIFKAGVNYFN